MDAPAAPPAPRATARPCASCAAPHAGRYCPACGERRLEADDLSARRFLGESLETLTDLDSTVVRTFGALVGRPGRLTAEYLAGRRTRYLRPVQVFLLCNVLFFFVQPLTGMNTLTSPLRVHLEQLPYSPLVRSLVEAEIAARGISAREYQLLFDATIASHARTLIAVMIPMFALLLAAAYPRRRRFFGEHLVFATHFYAFFLLVLLALSAFIHLLMAVLRELGALGPWIQSDLLWTSVLGLAWIAYLVPALGRVYGGPTAETAARAAALSFATLFVVQAYRLVLFFTAFLAV